MACGFTPSPSEWVGVRLHKSEALRLGLALVVHAGHECLEVGCFVVGDGWLWVFVVIILEYLREYVGNGLSFRVAHGERGGVGTFGHQLMLQPVALAVTHDDDVNLPQPQIIQELVAVVAYLAHD